MIPPRADALELLDEPEQVRADLAANLGDIRRLNRWFGGTALVVREVARHWGTRQQLTVLDVASGSADIPVALYRWGQRNGVEANIVACDISPDVLSQARDYVDGHPIALVPADARSLPWPDASFDLVLCSLALHHFGPSDAVQVLREMRRVSREGVLVVDLRRTYGAYAATWLVTRTLARNRLTQHDGPLSVLRAYTPGELSGLAQQAGLAPCTVTPCAFFRQALLCPAVNRDG